MPYGGSITLTSGSYVDRPKAGTAVLTAGLGAVEALVAGLAVELAPNRVRVNAIRPGPIDTPLLRAGHGFADDPYSQKADAALVETGSGLLLGRVGTAEEAAAAAVFMMTNNYVTGSVLRVDGGVNLS